MAHKKAAEGVRVQTTSTTHLAGCLKVRNLSLAPVPADPCPPDQASHFAKTQQPDCVRTPCVVLQLADGSSCRDEAGAAAGGNCSCTLRRLLTASAQLAEENGRLFEEICQKDRELDQATPLTYI